MIKMPTLRSKNIILIFILIISGFTISIFLRDHHPATEIKNSTSAYDTYEYGQGDQEKVVDFGTQPNAIFTSESLFHDRILQRQLAANGWSLREHRFRNGKDMVPYTDGRLDVMVLGDLPAYVAMSTNKVGIFAVCRQGYNTLVASHRITPPELKGLRVGYPALTTAHFAIDRALTSANLTLEDVISVPMAPDEMEAAMRSHTVDAIVSWEPTASSVLAIPGCAAISVSEGFSYISMDLDFTGRHPDIQKAVLAAVVRAAMWARQDEKNIRTHLQWDWKAATLFVGNSPVEPNAKWISLLRKETIDNPSFPMLPLNFCNENGLQHQQFKFLVKNKALSDNTRWQKICDNVNTHLLPEVIKDSQTWMINHYDYSSEKLYQGKEVSP